MYVRCKFREKIKTLQNAKRAILKTNLLNTCCTTPLRAFIFLEKTESGSDEDITVSYARVSLNIYILKSD